MDMKRVYKKERGKVYKRSQDRVQPSKHHSQYNDHTIQKHGANLHFVMNGQIVETIENDVTYSWANYRKNELKNQIPYCQGKLVVVSIYAKDQINGGKRKSSRTIPRK